MILACEGARIPASILQLGRVEDPSHGLHHALMILACEGAGIPASILQLGRVEHPSHGLHHALADLQPKLTDKRVSVEVRLNNKA
jgi:hypothetical protein